MCFYCTAAGRKWREKRAPFLKKGSCATKLSKAVVLITFQKGRIKFVSVTKIDQLKQALLLTQCKEWERVKLISALLKLTKTRSSARGLRTRTVNVEEITFGGSFSSSRNMCCNRNGENEIQKALSKG